LSGRSSESMREAARKISALTGLQPQTGLVLGSGWGFAASALSEAVRIPYHDLPGLPRSTVAGHQGELLVGRWNGVPVAIMCGRFHLYEGYTARQTASGMYLFRELGINRVVLTNAAGGIHPALSKGALALISDHINLQAANPLSGPDEDALGPRFLDLTEAYSRRLRQIARTVAAGLGIDLFEGVYAGLPGPSYETPAEIRYLQRIGADMVGMSTIAEAIAANYLGMEVLGLSCVTNMAAGLASGKLAHENVLRTAHNVSGTLLRFLSALVPALAPEM
jgi:purine-nucleoside phosphorylase